LLGLESSGWAKEEGGATLSLSTLAFGVTYYPGETGFLLRGGIGFASSSYELELSNGFTQSKTETGFGLQGAMGYEWRLTQKFAMGPQVEYVYLNIGGDLVDTANFFDATLGFNWYW
ncbi:MAG TPA: outer membrane beta-barrel protein, partial [Candidatus Krumholzibacteria bacterium]|nr:outer membrane beta-barrel protein [Candidatus Krumholzibacteria bacterium]